MAKRKKSKKPKAQNFGELQHTRTKFISAPFSGDGRFPMGDCTSVTKRLYKKDKVLILTEQPLYGDEIEVWRRDETKK